MFKKDVNMFECMEIAESICEDIVKTSYLKKLPGKTPTVLVTSGIREEKLPCLRLTPQNNRALESAENNM